MRRLILSVIFIAIASSAFSQVNSWLIIDSLEKAIPNLPEKPGRQKAIAMNDLAKAYMDQGNYTKAAKWFSECISLADRMKDSLVVALAYRNMAIVSFGQSDLQRAAEYNFRALDIYKHYPNSPGKPAAVKQMGDIHLTLKNMDSARWYYSEALRFFQKHRNPNGIADTYMNLSMTYSEARDQLRYAFAAKKIHDTTQTYNNLPIANIGNIGVHYLDMVRNNSLPNDADSLIPKDKSTALIWAEKYLREAIDRSRQAKDPENFGYFTGVLAELQELKGDYENAYKNIRIYYESDDSIKSQGIKNEIAKLQSKQEIDLKNVEIHNKELQLTNQRNQILLLAIVGVLVLISGMMFFRQATIRKRNNQVLQKLNAELDEANKAKARFFAILSHDLRSPISNLVNFLQLQQMQPGLLSAERVKENEQRITSNAKSLLQVMEGLLLWSKRQMQTFKPVFREVTVDCIFEDLKNYFSGTRNIHFTFTSEPGLAFTTDDNYMKTILHNLISNAVKAVQKVSNAAVQCRAWREDKEVKICIADNGPGFTPEQAANFLKDQKSEDSKHGLGLYIVRDLAAAINCEITLIPSEKGASILLSSKL